MKFVQRSIQAVGGLWELLLIGMRARSARGRRYWEWRRETAFGTQAMHVKNGTNALTPRERRRAIIHFGRWVWRMKRMR